MTSLATTLPFPHAASSRPSRERVVAVAAWLLTALIALAATRAVAHGGPSAIAIRHVWLAIHLATVIPALPLAGWLLVARKGTPAHRLLGRIWALLMLTTALASFGVRSSGHLSWIHLFSILVLVTVPRAVWLAIRGNGAAHGRAILRICMGLVGAGLFTFLPGRMLGQWLLG